MESRYQDEYLEEHLDVCWGVNLHEWQVGDKLEGLDHAPQELKALPTEIISDKYLHDDAVGKLASD